MCCVWGTHLSAPFSPLKEVPRGWAAGGGPGGWVLTALLSPHPAPGLPPAWGQLHASTSLIWKMGVRRLLGLKEEPGLSFLLSSSVVSSPQWPLHPSLFVSGCFFSIEGRTHGMWKFPGQGPAGAAAAGLHHSHSNPGSEPHLQPTPQLVAMPDL